MKISKAKLVAAIEAALLQKKKDGEALAIRTKEERIKWAEQDIARQTKALAQNKAHLARLKKNKPEPVQIHTKDMTDVLSILALVEEDTISIGSIPGLKAILHRLSF